MEIIKKIFGFLSAMPVFTTLFKKAAQTGKVDPLETLNALSSISSGTKKITDVAINTAQQGGNIADVKEALNNIGEIEIMGQKLNPKTLIHDLKKTGGFCSVLANIIEDLPNKNPQEVVNFGEAASNLNNWSDIVKSK